MVRNVGNDFRFSILILILLIVNFSGISLLASRYTPSKSRMMEFSAPQPQALAESLGPKPIVVDHSSIALFEQIPDEYLERARNMKLMFSDRSVGDNINTSLDCLVATSWDKAPAFCRRDYIDPNGNWKTFNLSDLQAGRVPERIVFSPSPAKYNRSNWTYVARSGSWQYLTQNFVQELVPAYIASNDVLTYQFSYLNVDSSDDIANPSTGFFATRPGDANRWDISDLEELERVHPNKKFIYWTTSLSRGIGTQVATDFNNQMRNYVITNNKVLFDVADIESYDENNNPCFDNRDNVSYCTMGGLCENHPDDGLNLTAICKDYTTETDGGHLGSVSGGRIRLAKAFWVLMAQIAGWDPNSSNVNLPPQVNAGTDLDVFLGGQVSLNASVIDDGLPNNTLIATWTNESALPMSFSDPSSTTTVATFNQVGTYTLRLTVTDGLLITSDTVVINVTNGGGSGENLPTYTPTPTPTITTTPTTTPTNSLTPTSTATPPVGNSYYLNFDSLNSAGSSCNACVNNNISLGTGVIQNSYQFNGTNSMVDLGTVGRIKGESEFTLNVWIRPNFDESEASNWRYVFSDGAPFSIFYLPNIRDFRVLMRTTTTTYRLDTVGLVWDPNSWHMLTYTYDGLSMRIYWDGVLKSTGNANGAVFQDNISAKVGIATNGSNSFSGSIDEFKLFNNALTASEVYSLYASY